MAGVDAAARMDGGADAVSDTPLHVMTDAGTPDVGETSVPPNPVTSLAAAVLDRRQSSFQLSWVAPAASWGGPVSGYEVRFARVPITEGNFDDATVCGTIVYGGTPAPVGQPDGVVAQTLNIETDYYFAVAAVDEWSNRGPITATTTPTRAVFNVTVLSGAGTDNSGFDLDGAGDFGTSGSNSFASDGLSDLLVGATAARHVYAYFGAASGFSTTPSITFTGSVNGFGRSVADIGDIDGDGKDDIAISSPNDSGGRVYVYSRKNPPASWGSTTAWPAALTDVQANYVISTPGTVTGVIAARGVQRLGDFDGDGKDDFAISYSGSNTNVGAVIVVKGSSTFTSLTPDTTDSVLFDGSIAGGVFGAAVVGIGDFHGSTSPATLVVTASLGGAVYSFTGVSPPSGVATTTAADDSTIGSATDRYGTTVGFLGPLGPSAGALTIGATVGAYVDLDLGTAATGPFIGTMGAAPEASVRLVDSNSGNSFGVVNFGSGVRGKSQAVSFIGGVTDKVPDLVLAGQAEAGNAFYLINGAVLTTLSGMVDVSAPISGSVPGIVPIAGKFPGDWGNGYTTGAAIVDLDGDGVGDFAIGEFVSGKPGRVAVFY